MTRREWLVKHVPENVMEIYGGSAAGLIEGGCIGCPHGYPDLPGTERRCDPKEDCEVCWTREVPGTGKEEKRNPETARRAVSIAARVMAADELCLYPERTMCEHLDMDCEDCIEAWLMEKAESELSSAEVAEIIAELKDID